jgi:hypothetical protein
MQRMCPYRACARTTAPRRAHMDRTPLVRIAHCVLLSVQRAARWGPRGGTEPRPLAPRPSPRRFRRTFPQPSHRSAPPVSIVKRSETKAKQSKAKQSKAEQSRAEQTVRKGTRRQAATDGTGKFPHGVSQHKRSSQRMHCERSIWHRRDSDGPRREAVPAARGLFRAAPADQCGHSWPLTANSAEPKPIRVRRSPTRGRLFVPRAPLPRWQRLPPSCRPVPS